MENVIEKKQPDYSKAIEFMLAHSKMVAQDAENSYFHQSIEKLYKWYIQCNQAESPSEGYLDTLRVVRIKRGLPKYVFAAFRENLDSDDAKEFARCFLSGCYMVVRCVHFSKKFVEENLITNPKGKYKLYALPSELKEVFKESTLNINKDGSAVALAKSTLTDWIYASSHYQMLEVSDF